MRFYFYIYNASDYGARGAKFLANGDFFLKWNNGVKGRNLSLLRVFISIQHSTTKRDHHFRNAFSQYSNLISHRSIQKIHIIRLIGTPFKFNSKDYKNK